MGARRLLGALPLVLLLANGCASASSRQVAAGPSRWLALDQIPVRTPEDIAHDRETSAALPDSYGRHEVFTCAPIPADAEPTFACYAAKRTKHQGFSTHGGRGRRVR
jgi:hypothetical protein